VRERLVWERLVWYESVGVGPFRYGAHLHVGRLGLLNSLIVLVTSLNLAGQAFVDLRKAIGQDAEVLLNLCLLLLLLQNLAVHFLALLT
jgi:hypothetical protein